MNKKIIYSSAALMTALLSASSIALAGGPEVLPPPDYFSGFYIGGMGGVHHNTFNGSATLTEVLNPGDFVTFGTITNPGVLDQYNFSGGEYDGYGGVQGGYGLVFNHQFYLGAVAWGEWGSTSENESRSTNQPNQSDPDDFTNQVLTTTTTDLSTTVKIENDAGIAVKLGWVVAPQSMFYGKIGASWARIKVSNSFDADTSIVTNTLSGAFISEVDTDLESGTVNGAATKIGLLLGAGFEQFVYQDIVSLFAEYTYTNYGNVSTSVATLAGTQVTTTGAVTGSPVPVTSFETTQASVSNVHVSSLMAGLNFYFKGDWI